MVFLLLFIKIKTIKNIYFGSIGVLHFQQQAIFLFNQHYCGITWCYITFLSHFIVRVEAIMKYALLNCFRHLDWEI